ncbi:hypothetical protein Daus18300_001463 [Diaporthe australafricana]|uniref:Tat pathway signal sequence n=1 Tax=Diaporthe australafricana TaxID=127596 RepID=A0ABR3XWS4_9PEZI
MAHTNTKSLDESSEPLLESELPRDRGFLPPWLRMMLKASIALYVIVSSIMLMILSQHHLPQPYCERLLTHLKLLKSDPAAAPVRDVLSYRREPLYFGEDSEYTGLPQQVDEAWDQLLEPVNIRASKHEIQQSHSEISDDIVRVSDGGYVSVLSVYHELHCLDTLRRNIFHDYYYQNATAEEEEYNILHMTYWIGDHTALPSKELRSNSDTVCVDWEAIDAWSRKRLLPKDKYKVKPGPFEKPHVA